MNFVNEGTKELIKDEKEEKEPYMEAKSGWEVNDKLTQAGVSFPTVALFVSLGE